MVVWLSGRKGQLQRETAQVTTFTLWAAASATSATARKFKAPSIFGDITPRPPKHSLRPLQVIENEAAAPSGVVVSDIVVTAITRRSARNRDHRQPRRRNQERTSRLR